MEISIDSRTIVNPKETIFFALKGKNYDSHNFIELLYQKGVRQFVISEWRDSFSKMPKAKLFCVDDVLSELQIRAMESRLLFKGEVVGITGSNGKTIVKEWIAQILGDDINISRSPRSYNSQIGVPLSIFNISQKSKFAIIEAGISKPGEMSKLQRIINPSIGIFTGIGDAHGENFSSKEDKLKSKLYLFKDSKVVISKAGALQGHNFPSFTWSEIKGEIANVYVESHSLENDKRIIDINFNSRKFRVELPMVDLVSFENYMVVVSFLLYIEFPIELIINRTPLLYPIAMRLEVKKGINHCILIEDSYNSDLESFKLALSTLSLQDSSKDKLVILSDFVNLELSSNELYPIIAKLINEAKISILIGIGDELPKYKELFKVNQIRIYSSTEDFLLKERRSNFRDNAILLKGARNFKFEKIAHFLKRQTNVSTLEINLNSLVENLSYFRDLVPANTKIAAMVKAFSYGSGSTEIAKILQYNGVDCFMVAFADEGVELCIAGINIPIVVLNPDEESFLSMIENRIDPSFSSIEFIKKFSKIVEFNGISDYPIHLKMNTGMNRSGFNLDDLDDLVNTIKSFKNIRISSVFSHLAASDDPNYDDFTRSQISELTSAHAYIQSHLGYRIDKHILNSAGIERFPDAAFDMVRLGIGLYGIGNKQELKVVSTFKTYISFIRKVKEGDTIGYGRMGKINKPSNIAVIPVGYADGLNRGLSNGVGNVFIQGKRFPIIGNICMDATMIDITGSSNIKIGDEVEIFGEQINIKELADKINTIPYEVFTSISPRVKRVYFRE